ncbi:MAG: hypothetical protein IIZ40_02270 [Bacilli bacterium]|nr:hypothetical protein [Bacilli bacterium]
MKLIKKIFKFFDKHVILPVTKLSVNLGRNIKKLYKPIEVVSKNKSSIIVLSLVISIVVFIYVDKRSTTLLETNAKVLYNQPVTATYNDEEYVIEGIPETVDITMIGTKANLYLAKQLPTQSVTVDLSDLKVGVHQVELKYKQSITSVEYKLDPSVVTVVVSPKQSVTKTLKEEVVNLDKLDSKLSIESVNLNKDEIIVKGTEAKIKEVSSIKALLNVNDLSDPKVGANKLKNVPVIAYDKDGKIMDVELVPNKVNAVINIESPSKEVPLEIVPTSLDKVVFGKSIESIESSVNKVTIYGSTDVLEQINKISVNVDVSELKDNKTYTKTIKKPKGIREISTKTVSINVKLGDESTTEINNVKLSYKNLNSNYLVQVTGDSTTEIPVILKGVKSVIEDMTAQDIEAYVDLKGLEAGEHEVDVTVSGNENTVTYKPKISKVKILIIEK